VRRDEGRTEKTKIERTKLDVWKKKAKMDGKRVNRKKTCSLIKKNCFQCFFCPVIKLILHNAVKRSSASL